MLTELELIVVNLMAVSELDRISKERNIGWVIENGEIVGYETN